MNNPTASPTTRICNPYAALVALRRGATFESIKPHITISDAATWAIAIGGAMSVIEDKFSSQLFQEIEKLDAWVETFTITSPVPSQEPNSLEA